MSQTRSSDFSSLIRMRRIATSALVMVFCGMIGFRLLESANPSWGYLRAFCEAATVGALADWFAVVALFRHPMGLPIPHTAILPNNRDRLAASLGNFIDTNFLEAGGIHARISQIDFADIGATWLGQHHALVMQRMTTTLSSWLDSTSSDAVQPWLSEQTKRLVGEADISKLAAATLESLLDDGRSQILYGILLKSSGDFIIANRPMIQEKIREEIPLPVESLRNIPGIQRFGPALDQLRDQLAAMIASRTIEKIQHLLDEAGEDEAHPIRQTFDKKLHSLITDLQSSPAMQDRIRTLQNEFSKSQALDHFTTEAWNTIRSKLIMDLQNSDLEFHQRLDTELESFTSILKTDEALRSRTNEFVKAQVLNSLSAIRPHIREYVISTVSKWDGSDIALKLESTVGRDLQFIRLNGTIIGGLIGLAIHAGFAIFGI